MPTLVDNTVQKALTTVARAKIFLSISGDTYDGLLTMLINQATGFIEQYCKRKFLSQTYSNEEYDGYDSNTLILKQFPITTFTQLQRNNNNDNSDAWETLDSEDYFVDLNEGIITAHSFTFQARKQKYRVTYVAGYKIDFNSENTPDSHNLPQEIEYACQKIVSALFNTRKAEGFDSTRVGDMSVVMSKTVFDSQELRAILDKYAKPTI